MSRKTATSLVLISAAVLIAGCSSNMGGVFDRPQPHMQKVPRSTVGAMSAYQEAIKLVEKLEYALAEPKLQYASAQFEAAGDDEHTAKSLFWLGFCREKLGQDDQARQAYVTVIQRFAGTKSAQSAKERLDAMNQP